MFNQKDLEQIKRKGIELDNIKTQLDNFSKGFPPANILKPAIINDGIKVFSPSEINKLAKQFKTSSINEKIIKFTPASGAASRMFQCLINFRNTNNQNDESIKSVQYFFDNLRKFAFYDQLKEKLNHKVKNIDQLVKEKDYNPIIDALLYEEGLNFNSLPKALLSFHKYESGIRTAFEEHLVEAISSTKDKNRICRLHFTLSPEHNNKINTLINNILPYYEKEYKVKFDISLSAQNESTDIIAVDQNNEPFRNSDNSLLFRPGGHGALLDNLNKLDADIVYIKNIDNIAPEKIQKNINKYKLALGTHLLELQTRTFRYLESLTSDIFTETIENEIKTFINVDLMVQLPGNFNNLNSLEAKTLLFNKLNRPMRVCGMVRNAGEPGGGPFWIKNNDGSNSLQIIEASQIDINNILHLEAIKVSTHFNPVDLVCAIKDYQNKAFNLIDFRDPQTGIITKKTTNGRELKAQELPGLWNGGMADWITIFVEVPITTFNPVKTINDLLRKEHL